MVGDPRQIAAEEVFRVKGSLHLVPTPLRLAGLWYTERQFRNGMCAACDGEAVGKIWYVTWSPIQSGSFFMARDSRSYVSVAQWGISEN